MHYSEGDVLELVSLIYEGAGNPQCWQKLLGLPRSAYGWHGRHHSLPRCAIASRRIRCCLQLARSCKKLMWSNYAAINPWLNYKPELVTPGSVVTNQMIAPDEVLR